MANDAERARPSRLIWQTDDTGATCDLSGLLRDSAHVRQARSRYLRAREGHGQHLQIRSLVSDPDDRHADHLRLGAALRAVEPPGDDRPRERPNGFKKRP